ncbi:MAG: hypothetical protein ACLQDQ_11255 [Myxococcaceae bacterium]
MESLNWHQVEARWETLRPRVAAYWSRLPADEVKRLCGDRASLVRLVKRYYALEQSGAEEQVDAWLAGLPPVTSSSEAVPPQARTKDEQRAEGEGLGVVPGAASRP